MSNCVDSQTQTPTQILLDEGGIPFHLGEIKGLPWQYPKDLVEFSKQVGIKKPATAEEIVAHDLNKMDLSLEDSLYGGQDTMDGVEVPEIKLSENTFYETHRGLVGKDTLEGRHSIQYLVHVPLEVNVVFLALEYADMIEFDADNKDNLEPVSSEEKSKRYLAKEKLVKTCRKAWEFTSLKMLRLLCEEHFFPHLGGKKLFFQLHPDVKKEVRAKALAKGISIEPAPVVGSLETAISHFHVAFMKGVLMTGLQFLLDFDPIKDAPNKGADSVLNSVDRALNKANSEWGKAKEAFNKGFDTDLDAAKARLRKAQGSAVKMLSKLNEPAMASIGQALVARTSQKLGLLKYNMHVLLAAVRVIEQKAKNAEDVVRIAKESKVSLLLGLKDLTKATSDQKAMIKKITELAKSGQYTFTDKKGNLQLADASSMLDMSPTERRITNIPAMEKGEDGNWTPTGLKVGSRTSEEFIHDCIALYRGVDCKVKSTEERVWTMSESLRGDHVVEYECPYTGVVTKSVDKIAVARSKRATELSFEFGINYRTAQTAAISTMKPKRTGLASGYYEGEMDISNTDIDVLKARYFGDFPQTEGRMFIEEHLANKLLVWHVNFKPKGKVLKAGEYFSGCRSIKGEYQKSGLEVVPNGSLPDPNKIFVVPGCFKDDVKVLLSSNALLFGHKHNPSTCRTNVSDLTQPEMLVCAATEFTKDLWSRANKSSVQNAVKRLMNTPVLSLFQKVPSQLIGNSQDVMALKFPLTPFGVKTVYLRAAMPWEGGMDFVGYRETEGGVGILNPEVFARIADICGGADSDDSFRVEKHGDGLILVFTRNPNIGLEKGCVDFTNSAKGEVN